VQQAEASFPIRLESCSIEDIMPGSQYITAGQYLIIETDRPFSPESMVDTYNLLQKGVD